MSTLDDFHLLSAITFGVIFILRVLGGAIRVLQCKLCVSVAFEL